MWCLGGLFFLSWWNFIPLSDGTNCVLATFKVCWTQLQEFEFTAGQCNSWKSHCAENYVQLFYNPISINSWGIQIQKGLLKTSNTKLVGSQCSVICELSICASLQLLHSFAYASCIVCSKHCSCFISSICYPVISFLFCFPGCVAWCWTLDKGKELYGSGILSYASCIISFWIKPSEMVASV